MENTSKFLDFLKKISKVVKKNNHILYAGHGTLLVVS